MLILLNDVLPRMELVKTYDLEPEPQFKRLKYEFVSYMTGKNQVGENL